MSGRHTATLEYRAAAADEPVLRRAFEDARDSEIGLLPDPLRTQLLDLQFTAQQQQFRTAYPHATDRIIVSDGQPVGRLLVHTGPFETVLVDIAILQEHRGRGLGSAVLAELCDEADAAQTATRLRMLSSKARLARWYGRFGFSQVGTSGAHLVLVRLPQPERSPR